MVEQDATIGELRMEAAAKAGVETALEFVRAELAEQQQLIGVFALDLVAPSSACTWCPHVQSPNRLASKIPGSFLTH